MVIILLLAGAILTISKAFRLVGIVGLILATFGILAKSRRRANQFFLTGGVYLEIYSLYLGDWIFILLQIIFTLAATYKLWEVRNEGN